MGKTCGRQFRGTEGERGSTGSVVGGWGIEVMSVGVSLERQKRSAGVPEVLEVI